MEDLLFPTRGLAAPLSHSIDGVSRSMKQRMTGALLPAMNLSREKTVPLTLIGPRRADERYRY